MPRIYTLILVSNLLFGLAGCKQKSEPPAPSEAESATPAKVQTVALQTAEAGCGSCIFKMPGVEGCKLAIKIEGQPYLVTGADIDAHEAGLCEASKQAQVAGRIEDGKFVATQFKLKP